MRAAGAIATAVIISKASPNPTMLFYKEHSLKKIINVIHSLERKYEIFYENVGRKLNSSADCWEKTIVNPYCEFLEYTRSAHLFSSYKFAACGALCVDPCAFIILQEFSYAIKSLKK